MHPDCRAIEVQPGQMKLSSDLGSKQLLQVAMLLLHADKRQLKETDWRGDAA